ncbi:MAG: TrkH family potassium uptake protein [Anaerolineae bacterium]
MTTRHNTPTADLSLVQPGWLARKNSLILVAGFALIILIGTVLLRLPAAGSQRPLTWEEALFISTSATTVTGLVVITPVLDLSLFGQIVVLLLMEIGGVGFIAFSVVLFALIGRRLGLAERTLLKETLGVLEAARIVRFTLRVLATTISIQIIGAFLLWLRWQSQLGPGRAAYLALFHAVSAFCNAGFDLFTGTGQILFGFGRDPFTLGVMMALIVIGGLGILVGYEVATFPWNRRFSIHTKLTLLISGALIIISLPIILADNVFGGTALSGMTRSEQFMVALFNVISARTAGLTIISLDDLSQASALVLMVSMFIGGAPASMAGGVTISTVGVLIVAVQSTVRGLPQAVVFGRVLPLETIAKAVAIMTVSTLLCFVVTLLLLTDRIGELLPVAFETVSAFSNTGYSLGATTDLDRFGRLLVAFTMFWGRLGPLTMVVLLAQRERPTLVRYPTEQIVLG